MFASAKQKKATPAWRLRQHAMAQPEINNTIQPTTRRVQNLSPMMQSP
jgi:hypothetical protein